LNAVLCWDVFDSLVPAAASVLAGELMRVLRPGGALLREILFRKPAES